jgi:cell division protein FtsQ
MAHASRAQMTKTRQKIRDKQDPMALRLYYYLKERITRISPRKAIITSLSICALFYVIAIIIAGQVPQRISQSLSDFTLEQSAKMGFVIDDVLITGRENIDKDWLKQSFSSVKGAPLFAIDAEKITNVLSRHPWVKDVSVQRLWPNRLKINITERKPALWQIDDTQKNYLKLIDMDGQPIGLYNRSAFPQLAVVDGVGANKAGLDFIPLLNAEPSIIRITEKAEYIGGRRWDIHLQGGITVKLPEKDLGLSLRKLALAHEEHDLFSRSIKTIDMRNQGRIILEVKNGQNEVLSLTDSSQAL